MVGMGQDDENSMDVSHVLTGKVVRRCQTFTTWLAYCTKGNHYLFYFSCLNGQMFLGWDDSSSLFGIFSNVSIRRLLFLCKLATPLNHRLLLWEGRGSWWRVDLSRGEG